MTTMAVTATTQRRRRPHPLVLLVRWLVLLTLIAAIVAATAVAFAPAPRVEATPIALPAAAGEPVSAAWPESVARSAGFAVVGIDGSAESWGGAEAMPMASLTKLVTVLAALEAHPIAGGDRGAQITLGRADINALGAAIADAAPTVPVYDGMVVDQRDLIEWALVDSAGNAAWSLANWAFGSIEAYLAAANDWTARHGLADTVVADPSGLSLDSSASAADMTELALLAVADPLVLETMAMTRVDVPGGSAANTNPLLGEGFVDGGKTGTLRVWGRNLFVTAERDIEGKPRRVVAVILGVATQDAMNAAMRSLVDSLWDDFGTRTLVPAGTPVAEYRAPWGSTVQATTAADLATDAFGTHLPQAQAEVAGIDVGAPRSEVGTVRVEGLDGTDSQVPVRTDAILPGPDVGWRLTHPLEALDWLLG